MSEYFKYPLGLAVGMAIGFMLTTKYFWQECAKDGHSGAGRYTFTCDVREPKK